MARSALTSGSVVLVMHAVFLVPSALHTLSERRVDSWLRLYNLSRTVSDQL
jgi:hypothetical protein